MSNLYIFAIGGSGSRVLRAMTMLLASGIEVNHNIVPMIIDPDSKNGDLQRAVGEMRLYKAIHDQLTFNDQTKSKFFSANIDSLNNDGDFLLPLNGTAGINYDAYIKLTAMSRENQAMMRMLFSNDNLSSTMDVGFKGNPNIGSVVLNQFTQSQEYKTFETNFVTNDKVFIISSIFGGTGASGFPLLLKSMRTSNNAALKDAYIGAVSLLPYFNLKDNNPKSKIKADSFITKMKAALNYYEKNVTGNNTLDDMYYLGDQLSSQTYNNNDGGEEQQNDAHIIELLAALAIVDFDKKKLQPNSNRRTKFHEFGLNTTPAGSIVFNDFGSNTKTLILKPLAQMAIMNSYLNNRDISHMESQRWAKDKKEILGDKFFNGVFYKTYQSFKSGGSADQSGFERWLDQMEKNQKSFAPFAKDSDLKNQDGLNKVVGYPPHYGFAIIKKKGYDLIDEKLSTKLRNVPRNLNAPSTFMELFYETTEELCSKNNDIN
jgi:hypothetical protein